MTLRHGASSSSSESARTRLYNRFPLFLRKLIHTCSKTIYDVQRAKNRLCFTKYEEVNNCCYCLFTFPLEIVLAQYKFVTSMYLHRTFVCHFRMDGQVTMHAYCFLMDGVYSSVAVVSRVLKCAWIMLLKRIPIPRARRLRNVSEYHYCCTLLLLSLSGRLFRPGQQEHRALTHYSVTINRQQVPFFSVNVDEALSQEQTFPLPTNCIMPLLYFLLLLLLFFVTKWRNIRRPHYCVNIFTSLRLSGGVLKRSE